MIRSWLFVFGDKEDKLDKSRELSANAIIINREDAVVFSSKAAARKNAALYLAPGVRMRHSVWVRITSLDSGQFMADLEAVVHAWPDGLMLPNVGSATDVTQFEHYLEAFEYTAGLPAGSIQLLPIAFETPRSLLMSDTYAGRRTERLARITWGAVELRVATTLQIERAPGLGHTRVCQYARTLCVVATAGLGVPAIDTICPNYQDLGNLKARAMRGRLDGFLGMLAIHPSHLPIINEVFTPSEDEMRNADNVIEACNRSTNGGAIVQQGQMLDLPYLLQAKRILDMHAARSSNMGRQP